MEIAVHLSGLRTVCTSEYIDECQKSPNRQLLVQRAVKGGADHSRRRGSRSTRNRSRLTVKKVALRRYRHRIAATARNRRIQPPRDGPAAAFLHRLTENHDITEAAFLVDAAGYLTVLVRRKLSGQLNYRERNHIEKWFYTVTMRIDRFHSFSRGSQASAKRWLRHFRHHYNHERPNQVLNSKTPAEVIQK